MRYKFDFYNKKQKNKKTIYIVVFLVLVVFISSFIFRKTNIKYVNKVSDYITFPIRKVSGFVSNSLTNLNKNFGDTKEIKEKNIELENKINGLELQLLESKRILDENESLKKMLEINNTYKHFVLKSGKIITREHDNFSQTFVIDVGESGGVKLNQAVIHKEGLVGYISGVSTNSSVVTTILDPKTSVSVTISTVNEPAILRGNLELKSKNNLKLEYIPINAEISTGDLLYSSGLGSIYPSSILVGKIVTVVNNKNDSDRYAIIEPSVNINSIKEVSVVIE